MAAARTDSEPSSAIRKHFARERVLVLERVLNWLRRGTGHARDLGRQNTTIRDVHRQLTLKLSSKRSALQASHR